MTIARKFCPPEPLAAAIRAIRDAAQSDEQVYIVGGTVRDVLLGRDARDLDVAVGGGAEPLARRLADMLDGFFVELDDEREIFRVVLRSPVADGPHYIDVAALRGPLDEDLRRRDFTIDAMAVALGSDKIIDPTHGISDIEAGLVRMTDLTVFDADPLRLLRGARIASEISFEVEAATAAEIRARAHTVTTAAAERIRDELAHMIALDDVYRALRLLDTLELLDVLLPEVAAGKGVTQPEQWHAFDVFEHGMRAVEAMDVILARDRPGERAWMSDAVWNAFAWSEVDLRLHLAEDVSEGRSRATLLRLAALLHDVGKPRTRSVGEGGRIRFFGHADEGARIASQLMRRLRFSSAEVRYVSLLVAEHLHPVQLGQVGEVPTKRAVYRFNRALGDSVSDVLLLALADAAGSRGPALTSVGWAQHVAYMNGLLVRSKEGVGILHAPSLLTGNDIMSDLGISAGPTVGTLLEALREAEAVGEVADQDQARAFVRRHVAELDLRSDRKGEPGS